MAEQPVNSRAHSPESASGIKPGRPPSQNLDRERGDPNSRGDPPSKGSEEQGNPSDRRINGPSGAREGEAEGIKGDRGLPASPSNDNPFLQSPDGAVLKIIANRFNEARSLGKVGAWRQLQGDLMNAMPIIVPAIIPLKDLLNLVADIEKEIKGASPHVGKSEKEHLRDFLSGTDDLGLTDHAIISEQPEGEGGVDAPMELQPEAAPPSSP